MCGLLSGFKDLYCFLGYLGVKCVYGVTNLFGFFSKLRSFWHYDVVCVDFHMGLLNCVVFMVICVSLYFY